MEPTAPAIGADPLGEIEGIEAEVTSRLDRQGGCSHRLGQAPVLPLRVEDEGPPAKGQLAQDIGLDQRALASADLTEDDGIGVGQRTSGVEAERVIGEEAAQQVRTDHDARDAVAYGVQQWIEGADVSGGRLVAGRRGRSGGVAPPHGSPPQSGRVATSPRLWSPWRRRRTSRA